MIKIVLDALIPGDSQLRMPPASILDFNSYEIKYGIQQIVIDFLFELTIGFVYVWKMGALEWE